MTHPPRTRGNTAPEVGLELHSLPRTHWTPRTCGIRPGSKAEVWTKYTFPNCPVQSIAATSRTHIAERTPSDLGSTHLNSDDPRAHVVMASIKLMRSRRPV